MGEFKTLADKLLKQLNAGQKDKLKIHIPKHELQKIEEYSYTAAGVLGAATGAGAAGAAAGFAVYGGVMALGAASTGTAISALSGVAATNATLAALGGGALSAGGLGMAGGTAILGGAVVAPVLAIAGWAYDSHGDEALKNARKADAEVTSAIGKLERAGQQLKKTADYTKKIKHELSSINGQFLRYFEDLIEMNDFIEDIKSRNIDVTVELEKHRDGAMHIIGNGMALATIMVNIITTPLFKTKMVNGNIVYNQDGVPEMAKDSDGSMILNDSALDVILKEGKREAENLKIA